MTTAAAADPLAAFTPTVRDWFGRAFEGPTPAQAQAWPAIATGEHVLISAPTGSGKTLAAFLWGLDRLARDVAWRSPVPATEGTGDVARRSTLAASEGTGDVARRSTLAASEGRNRFPRLVYVSPLKALAYDIDRNLRAPLRASARTCGWGSARATRRRASARRCVARRPTSSSPRPSRCTSCSPRAPRASSPESRR